MDKSTSNGKPLPRRSPRTGASAALLAARENMKMKGKKGGPDVFVRDDYETALNAKELLSSPTGIVYNDNMMKHYCLWDENYPECPDRYATILKRCKELGLLDRCLQLDSRLATEAEILMQHTHESVNTLAASAKIISADELEKLSSRFDAIYINNDTYDCALLAAGSTIELVDAIIKGKVQNGMAIVRPPGHHAKKDEYNGYCFFNNVAIAAKHALYKCGKKRILIVDWDVHHGQGTQEMFYDDPRVVYFSISRYEYGMFWPELREGNFDCIGEKAGKGFNFNVPLNDTGMKDADYLAIFHQLLLPVAYEFQPELVLVSAGFDAAIGCPEGNMEISPACYAHLLSPLMGLAQGKVAVVLEGGYCLKSLSEGAALTLRTLLGDPAPCLKNFGTPCDSVVESILNVIYAQRQYWQCFQIQESFSATPKRPTDKPCFSKKHYPIVKYSGDSTKLDHYDTRNCYPVPTEDFVLETSERLDYLQNETDLSVPPNRVALVYDERMALHRNNLEGNHPEKPERITAMFRTLQEFKVLERCLMVEPRFANNQEILMAHTKSHLEDMKETANLSPEKLNLKAENYDSIYFHEKSFDCALLAAGSLLQVVDTVLSGTARSGVAVIRPPGHHAEENTACGFCIFNNVAVAAKYAINVFSLERILLIDWDVHHGNGTQHIFESDNRVLYVSLHRYNNGKFFPSSQDADFDKVGKGKGAGYNVNIPWNKSGGGMTDGDYIAAFFSIILPIAYEFDPQLVLVSAGFDACINDPLGHCKVTPEAYAHMTHWLTTLANGKVILCLEGGYNVTSISYALTLCTKALLGDPLPALSYITTPCPSAIESIRNVLKTHEKYWSCLRFNVALPKENVLKHVDKLDDLEDLTKRLRNTKLEENVTFTGDQGGSDAPEDGNPRDNARAREGRASRDSDQEGASPRPISQTLVGYLSDNMQRLLNQEMFAVIPLSGCPHLVEVQAVPRSGIDVNTPCATCESVRENWICLVCYEVFCGRYENQHMIFHNEETTHPLTLSFTDLSVWCYVCEAYIDNMILYPAKNAAHRSKFGSDLEWSYGDRSPQTRLSPP